MISPDCIIDFENYPDLEKVDIDFAINDFEYEELCRLSLFLKLGEKRPFPDYLGKLLRQYYELRCLSERFIKMGYPTFIDSEEIHEYYSADLIEAEAKNRRTLIDVDSDRLTNLERIFEPYLKQMRLFNSKVCRTISKLYPDTSSATEPEASFQASMIYSDFQDIKPEKHLESYRRRKLMHPFILTFYMDRRNLINQIKSDVSKIFIL